MPAFLLALLLPTATVPCDTLVVCPPRLEQAFEPWLEYRRSQGHQIRVITGARTDRAIRAEIRGAAGGGKLRFVVLVGDVAQAGGHSLANASLPAHYEPANVTVRWGSEPWIATDNWYADLDDDHLPDVAVGRITADSPEELSLMIGKIIAYEQTSDFKTWRRRVNFVAGLGGFGPLADTAIELAAKKLITDGVPAPYATSMTYASWRSAYCPSPASFRQATLERLNEGCLFWVYLGHGQQRGLDWVRVPGGAYPVLTERDVPAINCASGAPIACFLSCYAGCFDATEDCLAERMLRTAGAPVAVICGSRVTMPYAMAVLGTELLDECFARRSPTLGEALCRAKRSMVQPARKSENRLALDGLAGTLSPAPAELKAELAEHLHLFNLLGDPCLRLRHPQTVDVACEPSGVAGQRLVVRGDSPIAGDCTIELVARRDRLTFSAPSRAHYDGAPGAQAALDADYRRANDPRYMHQQVRIKTGPFKAELAIPAHAFGPGHVRIYVAGNSDFAVGAADVTFERAKSTSRRAARSASMPRASHP